MTSNMVNKHRITVKLESQVGLRQVLPVIRALGGNIVRTFKLFPYIVIELDNKGLSSLSVARGVADYFEDGLVHTLEQVLPWGVDRIEADKIHTQYGLKGFGVKVGVIDTGIDLNHPDLKVVGGYSAISTTYHDDNGHGTHVAGIIAALDNNLGVIGVAPLAQLYAIKVLNSSGSGNWSDLAKGIEWCITNKMDVISMSLGGSTSDALVEAAVKKAYEAGIVVVTAAGNSGSYDGSGDSVQYPGKYPEAIAVAATDSTDKRASFSSTGPDVEVAAPGVGIYSTYLNGTYKTLDGTSMATPHVSGLVALIKSSNPTLTNVEIRKILTETAIDLGPVGRDPWFGFGLIDAIKAVVPQGSDDKPPYLSFISPSATNILSGVAKIEVTAYDLSSVSKVELFIDDIPVAFWTAAPYVYYWDTTKILCGIHTLKTIAIDSLGNTGELSLVVKIGIGITIVEPRPGIVAKDILTVKAQLTDNGIADKVEFYVDNQLKNTLASPGNEVAFSWDSKEITLTGSTNHEMKILAYYSDIITSTTTSIIVRNPAVLLTSPEANATLTASADFSLIAHVTDSNSISKVEFFCDYQLISSHTAKPYAKALPLKDLTVGKHTLLAKIYAADQRLTVSNPLTFNRSTTVSFISPKASSIISGTVSVSANFADAVRTAELFANSTSLGKKTVNGVGPVTWSFNTSGYTDLSVVQLKIGAYTVTDNVLSGETIYVTIDNYKDLTPPQIKLISPNDGYLISNPEIELLAEASDESTINFVEFFVDEQSLGKVPTSPYKLTADGTTLSVGKHYLMAKAQDIFGNVGNSTIVTVFQPTKIILISPADQTILQGVINEFKFSCSDELLGTVQLFIDGNYCSEIVIDTHTKGDFTIPFTWDTTRYPNGSTHSITIEAKTFRDSVTSIGNFSVITNNTLELPFSITLTAQMPNSNEGIVLFTIDPSDIRELKQTEFYVNGNLAKDQVFPLQYQWDATKNITGNYSFSAKVVDSSDTTALSNTINLTLPTSTVITAPVHNSTLYAPIEVFVAQFKDPVAGNVDLYIDGEFKTTVALDVPTTEPIQIRYMWDTTGYPQLSQHDITIIGSTAKDSISSSGTVRVFVDNRPDSLPPTIDLLASQLKPTPGSAIEITANAIDNIAIKYVEIYKNGQLVTTLDKPPYSFTWYTSGEPIGKYSFYAKAYDEHGNVNMSKELALGLPTLVKFIAPMEKDVVSGTVQEFIVNFADDIAGFVDLIIDNRLVASKKFSTVQGPIVMDYPWNTLDFADGTHEIRIRAYTVNGQVKSEDHISVVVDNSL